MYHRFIDKTPKPSSSNQESKDLLLEDYAEPAGGSSLFYANSSPPSILPLYSRIPAPHKLLNRRYILLIAFFEFLPSSPRASETSHRPRVEDVRDCAQKSLNGANSQRSSAPIDQPFAVGCKKIDSSAPRENATFMILASNSEIDGVVSSMTSLEQRFNKHFQYPYVFLNDVEFDENFKAQVSKHTKAKIEFGRIQRKLGVFQSGLIRQST